MDGSQRRSHNSSGGAKTTSATTAVNESLGGDIIDGADADAAPASELIPLTTAQYGMWLNQEMAPEVAYTVAQYVDIHGPLDVDLLTEATLAAAEIYDSPRMRIVIGDDGSPCQYIDPDIDLGARRFDIPGLDTIDDIDDRIAFAVEWMRQDYSAATGFDDDQPIRNYVIEIAEDRWLWYSRAHHAVLDGFGSANVLTRTAAYYTAQWQARTAAAEKAAAAENADGTDGTDCTEGAAVAVEPVTVTLAKPRPAPRSVAELVHADTAYLNSSRADGDARYWDGVAQTLPDAAGLTRHIAPPSTRNLRVDGNASEEVSAHVAAAAERLQTTTAGVVIAAYGSYVAAMSDHDAITLTLPVAARTTAALRNSAGMVANAVPLPVRCGPGATIADVIEQTGRDLRNALRHQLYPAARIAAPTLREGVIGSTFGNAINIMMFSTSLRFGDLEGTLNLLTSGPTEDVAVTVYASAQGALRVDMEANPASHTEDELARHHARFIDYLDLFASSEPETLVTDVDSLTDDDHYELGAWTGVDEATAHIDMAPLPVLLAEAVAESPAQVAIEDGVRTMTYAELDHASLRLARHLVTHGAQPETTVVLRMGRGLEYAVALWAVTRTGAAFVPVDPRVPAERAERIIAGADPVVIIDADDVIEVLSGDAHDSTVALPEYFSVDHPAYLIYTSGSTGRPKGVSVTHRGLVSLAAELVHTHGADAGGRIMQFVSTGFDASVLEVLLAVRSRSALVVVPTDLYGGPELQRYLADAGVTGGFITPAALATLEPDALPALTALGVGGDTVPAALVDKWADGDRDGRLTNVYGPTETTIAVTLGPLSAGAPVRLGGPIPGTRLYVLNRALWPVAPGAVGELYISGPGVARGYHGSPTLTAERFIADPFVGGDPDAAAPDGGVGDFPTRRMYRTGDLVRWDGGTLEFLGRSDSQVKVRGFRIELGEIDAALMRIDGIERAVTRVVGEESAAELISWVTGSDNAESVDVDAATETLRRELPPYMVPGHIVALDAFPLTVNGKVDFAALPRPVRGSADAAAAGAGAARPGVAVAGTEHEQLVAETFVEVLGGVLAVDDLDVHADFFDIGGNSLSATRVAARLTEYAQQGESPRRISVADVFRTPTVSGLAALLTAADRAADEDDTAAAIAAEEATDGAYVQAQALVDQTPELPAAPPSPAQHQMWLRNLVSPDGAYHIPVSLTLYGELDVLALQQALVDVVTRHAPLRTRYLPGQSTTDGPRAEIASVTADLFDLPVVVVEDADEDQDDVGADPLDDSAVQVLASEFASRPFDLAVDLPIRACLFEHDTIYHTLVLVVHHIAADGWSMLPLARDLASAYAARRDGAAPTLPPLAVQYAEHSRRHAAALDERRDELHAYWARTLEGAPAESIIPPSRLSTAAVAETITGEVDRMVWSALEELARSRRATPFLVVQAALSALLSRLGAGAGSEASGPNVTGAGSDVVIGTAVAGRGSADLDELVGMFVNSIPLRTKVDEAQSFGDLVATVAGETLDAFDHADLPLEEIIELADPPRRAGRHPLFQVMLNQLPFTSVPIAMADLSVTVAPVEVPVPRFDLEFTAVGDGTLTLRYDASRYLPEQARGILDGLCAMLTAAAGSPDVIVGDLPVMTDFQHSQLWPARTTAEDYRATLGQMLAQAVRQGGDAPALIDGAAEISYLDLSRRAAILAVRLQDRGFRGGDVVACLLPRSVDWFVTLWAAGLAGGGFLALNPDDDVQRLSAILADSGAALGVTDADRRLDGLVGDTEWVVTSEDSGDPVGRAPRRGRAHHDEIAFLHYPAGTDDVAGVVLTHRGLANLVEDLNDRMQVNKDSRILAAGAPDSDAALAEVLLALRGSAPLVLPDASVAEIPATHGFLTPTRLSGLAEGALPNGMRVLAVGEPITAALADRLGINHTVFAGIGVTEATLLPAITDQLAGTDGSMAATPLSGARLGRGTTAAILDRRLRPVPIGAAGELYLSGPQLARGYHGRAARTATHFIASPFGAGERAVRTGLRCRWMRDDAGRLTVVDATQRIVALGGADTADATQIERILGTQEGVDTVAVGVHPDPDGIPRIVAHISGVRADRTAIAAYARANLPAALVPGAIVILDEPAFTPAGALDRSELTVPADAWLTAGGADAATLSTVQDAFAEVLGVAAVGPQDDFFALGGNSLSATTLIGALGGPDGLGVSVPVRTIFDNPTPESLAVRLAEAAAAVVDTDAGPPLTPAIRTDRIPLSSAQQRMWLLNRIDDGPTYNIAAAFESEEPLAAAALEAALRDVAMRHETLRTRFASDIHGPHQVIVASHEAAIELRRPAEEGALSAAEVAETLADFAAEPFDLGEQAPLRALLIERAEGGSVFALVVHHIAADGASMAALARDLFAAYRSRRNGMPPSWEPLPIQYADYAVWRRAIEGYDDSDLDYFVVRLLGAPTLSTFPADRSRPAVADTAAGEVYTQLSAAERDGALALARAHGASLFMVLHSALAALLHRMTDADDVVVGTPVVGRSDPRLRDVVGMFVNMLGLRVSVDPAESFAALLQRVRTADLDDLTHAEAPFDRVVEQLAPERTDSAHPVFQVVLNVAEQADPELLSALTGLRQLPLPATTTTFDLTVEVTPTALLGADSEPAGLAMTLRYRRDLYSPETVFALAERLRALLAAAVRAPHTPVGELPLITADEYAALTRPGAPGRPDPEPVTLPDVLALAVEQKPQAAALRWGQTSYTYGELDSAVTALVDTLALGGVQPGAVVAVAIRRSAASVIAFWAVARLGAVYLPVDPTYPSERISYLLDDAAPSIGITTESDRDRLPENLSWLVIDDEPTAPASVVDAESGAGVSVARPLDAPAYMIYTSGSTGRPKGVVVTHRGIAAFADTQAQAHGVRASSRVLHFASPSFDAAILETLLAAWSAAELVVAPTTLIGGSPLGEFLTENRITHAFVTPAALATVPPAEYPDLQVVSTGGDVLHPEVAGRWSQGRAMLNMYGPTEGTVAVSMGPVSADSVGIGSAVAQTQVLVCDDRLNLLPPGVVGELYAAGPGVAQGYHGRTAQTSARFVANPYAVSPVHQRMYRTGDLVRWSAAESGDPTVRLEFVGRADDQHKVRGFRVELGEVTRAVESHPALAAAAVIVDYGDGDSGVVGGETSALRARLVAYYVATHPVDVASLTTHVADRLPGYMVPSIFIPVADIPLTPNGKVDRRALPNPSSSTVVSAASAAMAARSGTHDGRSEAASTAVSAGASPLTDQVAAVLAEVLGVPALGPADDFFAAGGTSLQAALAVDQLRDRLGATDASIRWFFDDARVGAIADRIAGSEGIAAGEGAGVPGVGPEAAARPGSVTDPLLPLRAGEAGQSPLYCIHPAVGLAWSYLGLATTLDPRLPIIGVQARGIDHPMPQAASVGELARTYLGDIRRAQPSGPYTLVGWSLGGLIAHAMAVELQALGEQVHLVIMDAYPLAEYAAANNKSSGAELTLGQLLAEFAGLDVADDIDPAAAMELLRAEPGPARELSTEQLTRLFTGYQHHVELGFAHVPGVFDGDLLLFRAAGAGSEASGPNAAGANEHSNGRAGLTPELWREYVTGNITVRDIDAEHNDLASAPAIEEIGAGIDEMLRAVADEQRLVEVDGPAGGEMADWDTTDPA